MTPATQPSAGFGLGLRTPHYADFLAEKQNLDWLEIITDNFLVEGGKPMVMLDTIRRDYPMAMHGVAMSIGAATGLDPVYLRKVKALADRVQPLWVSDHLCWTGPGPEQLHDLYPMPYTDEAAHLVVQHIQQAQDVLQRRLVLENVSSYIDFKHNSASEWQFLAYIAEAADCLLLVDVNNIYVSSVNHGFDPLDYLAALPAHRVQQIHLAGHSSQGSTIIDTHDHPVAPAVWELYAKACRCFGPVATMIERDDHIPPLPTLIAELGLARDIAAVVFAAPADAADAADTAAHTAYGRQPATALLSRPPSTAHAQIDSPWPTLAQVQRRVADYILDLPVPSGSELASHWVRETPGATATQRLGIYHHAYRSRLAEVLADSFAKTQLYMGSDTFDAEATGFAVSQPPATRSLGRYGAGFPAYLATRYPDNPELHELAQLDWDLRSRFDGPDIATLSAESAQAAAGGTAPAWLHWRDPLHPSLTLRRVTTNVTQLWRAMDADASVPEVHQYSVAQSVAVWRKGLQPHFQTLEADESAFLHCLMAGHSIDQAASLLTATAVLTDPQRLGRWLKGWLSEGVLRDSAMSL